MGITKKIAPIPKSVSGEFKSLESSLASYGYYRFPSTARTLLPYKDGMKYRTGLDPNAVYLQKLSKEEREAEVELINEALKWLKEQLGEDFDLSPTSKFYNFSSSLPDDMKVSPVKMGTQDKFFNLSDPLQCITWHWMRVHPTVAPSLDAVYRGDYHIDTVQYYIADDEADMKAAYLKKQTLNKALLENEKLTPTKRKQVARLMGLPVTEHTKEEKVYNLIDEALKGEKSGQQVTLFNELVKMKEDRLKIKDMVRQALVSSVYRQRSNGRIYEGENEVAASEIELVDYLSNPKHQEELFALEKKLNITKLQDA